MKKIKNMYVMNILEVKRRKDKQVAKSGFYYPNSKEDNFLSIGF